MAFTVNPSTYVISIPKTDLTFVSGTLYTHDTDVFRLALKTWEESEEGIVQVRTHSHNTEVTIVGTTYARAVNMLAPYSVEYEDGAYSVQLLGSNNNIWDIQTGILVQNQVQVIPTNAAGLIVKTIVSGSGVTAQDKLDIADQVWDETLASHSIVGSTGKALSDVSGGSSPETIAAAVWAYASRSLTTFGSLVTNIWTNATRLLTGSALTTAQNNQLMQIENPPSQILNDYKADVSTLATEANATTNKNAVQADIAALPTGLETASFVWDEDMTTHNVPNSSSEMMKNTKRDVGDAQGLILAK